jgi:saccharopine dehydrogenase-like NADP-dependent oxidoreductase
MRIALLGAGIIGAVVARDLATWDRPEEVVVGDLDGDRAREVAGEHGYQPAMVDVRDDASLDSFLAGADVVINAAQYEINLPVMEGALRAGAHYTDLGGWFYTTRKQLELHDRFKAAGLTAVLGIGSCPGIANVHAGDLAGRLDTVESVRIFNGSTVDLSDSLRPPYSLWTILDEIVERPMVFRDGAFVDLDPLSEEEMFHFRDPIGYAKTHLSLHSEVATIPLSLADQGIRNCEFKIGFFGYSEAALRKLQFLASVGLASTEPRRVGEIKDVVPRQLLAVAEGTRDGSPARFRLDTVAWPSEELEVKGGTVVVGSPAAIAGRWLGSKELNEPGVYPPEKIVPPQKFYAELARRGVRTTLTEESLLAG